MPALVIRPLADVLRQQLSVAARPVERSIFGTADADEVADMVSRSAGEQLGVPVVGGEFYTASSGCVVGLHLADGRVVVLKAYQPHWEPAFLQAVQRVQGVVSQSGFPCPLPLAGPFPVGHGWATVETHMADPGQVRPLGDWAVPLSSGALVQLLRTADAVEGAGLEAHPFRIAPGDLYPTPHSPIFDLSSTGAGAEWIDDFARVSWQRRTPVGLSQHVGHLDWSANNVRLGPQGVTAVYDWDSLGLASHAVTAGQAAATWRATGDPDDPPRPDAAEIDRFIEAFAGARGQAFSSQELVAARAAAVWVMAYTARCEHALEMSTQWVRTQAREWLRAHGTALL
jgi:hypothetical protein